MTYLQASNRQEHRVITNQMIAFLEVPVISHILLDLSREISSGSTQPYWPGDRFFCGSGILSHVLHNVKRFSGKFLHI